MIMLSDVCILLLKTCQEIVRSYSKSGYSFDTGMKKTLPEKKKIVILYQIKGLFKKSVDKSAFSITEP